MKPVVAAVGEGLLADLVYEELNGRYEVVRQTGFKPKTLKKAELALMLQDEWRSSVFLEAEEAARSAGIPLLCGFVSFGEGVVGPLVRPDAPGCSQCSETRRLMAGRDREEMTELLMRLISPESAADPARPSRPGLRQTACLLAAETERALRGGRAYTVGRVYLVDLKTLKSSLHSFLPDPLCPVCGGLPDDSPEAARITLKPNPKADARSYRIRPLDELKPVLAKDYLDARTGLLNGRMRDSASPFAQVTVTLPLVMTDELTSGRTHSYAESELVAILEGLERNCGLMPRGKRTVVYDAYRNLADYALNPVLTGVHAKEQYERPDFPFKPFDPDSPTGWVWGYSFLQMRPILVPELLAYYSAGHEDGFVYETSNGSALGGSLEEALFHGILEVVERDSFLMTWYAMLPVPRLDPDSSGDKELRLMIERMRAAAGYDVRLFNTTMENGIPAVWALAKNRSRQGVHLVCAGGAHFDPVRAAKSAVHELAGMLPWLNEKFAEDREECERMFADPFLVRDMTDHPLLYGLPQAEERLRFLLDERRPAQTFDEAFRRNAPRDDLTDDLRYMIDVFRRLNLDVIAVDQSSPETARNGLYCVKVLIPGMLPMTFGHHLVRLTGLNRVLEIPAKLGYAKRPLAPAELNPHPHPFP